MAPSYRFGELPTNLPPAPDGPVRDWDHAARRAVTVLVRELNDLIAPLIDQLDAGVAADRE